MAARTGDWAGTQRLLATHSASLDQLAGPTRAMAEALEAMAASKLGASGGRVDRARLFREASPENLEQAWPELAEFVERACSGPVPTP